MRKVFAPALAALTFGGALMATAAPAQADGYRGNYYRHHHSGGDKAAVAAIAGIAGLAIGAAIADGGGSRSGYYSSRSYSRSGYYGNNGYYRNGYSYDPYGDGYYGDYYGRPRTCITRERVWDPYIGRNVSIERRYAC